ncbi:conserved hypothetical protein [Xenorhabdus nematophila F1]|uniref:Uncharacterized protein n=1 Tax=Xenorhabdus nematophila (strain ATCC 19061 / DSM 3370 / CCUG 14189 / LMG 1036 / NCIMB 9965 / AN6) TaxID=406817 RepID=D3V9P9_XENNA|nr:hypothetical protein XNC1_1216 [Xenorhabdus nematophila ATCC 19061]CCW30247.1 conserved hypothetical protein [Xenorhabdus nematophila F1]CEE95009.1 hypothetical protein XNA1_4890013 [Xenorhabdus nematophila str. Anatoliense]CEF29265.1 hypothetical protein XNW1_1660012 [Xenorhabdus nematophila str. Websteri]CEK22190.1 hypothetical protein XNC2_1194 [Xenorhabdus nematophila AN6/1]
MLMVFIPLFSVSDSLPIFKNSNYTIFGFYCIYANIIEES